MKQKKYKVLGHEVEYNVPENSQEFNALDKKRSDAACDEATANIVYRGMNPDTRSWFLHGREAVEATADKPAVTAIEGFEDQLVKMLDGVEVDSKDLPITRKTKPAKNAKGEVRMKDGAQVEVYDESEDTFYNRGLSLLVKYKKFASEDFARAQFDGLIKKIASEVPFDVEGAERAERGPKKLAAKYKTIAAKVLSLGNLDAINANQLVKIGKSFTPTGDTATVFEGTFPGAAEGETVPFKVSDKDAEALGWLLKEYFDWKSSQELLAL